MYQKRAVSGLDDLHEVSIDPVALAESYSDNKCDGIIVFDLSSTDREHEEAIDIIKEICATVAVPVIGAGAIHRMEDVKNYSMPDAARRCLIIRKKIISQSPVRSP